MGPGLVEFVRAMRIPPSRDWASNRHLTYEFDFRPGPAGTDLARTYYRHMLQLLSNPALPAQALQPCVTRMGPGHGVTDYLAGL